MPAGGAAIRSELMRRPSGAGAVLLPDDEGGGDDDRVVVVDAGMDDHDRQANGYVHLIEDMRLDHHDDAVDARGAVPGAPQ